MASVVKLGTGKKTRRAIDFKDPLGKRKRIYLGNDIPHDESVEIARQVQRLVDAKRMNREFERQSIAWLEDIGNAIFEKLVGVGLVESRPKDNQAPKLSDWLEKYMRQRQTELEPASIEKLEKAKNSLLWFFDADPRIDEITPDDAADWLTLLACDRQAKRID